MMFAHATSFAGDNAPNIGCELNLAPIRPGDLKTLRLNADLVARLPDEDIPLVRNVLNVIAKLDEPTLESLALHSIDYVDPEEISGVKSPVFDEFASSVRPIHRANLLNLRQYFAEDFSEYELGLLAYLLPDQERASGGRTSGKVSTKAALSKHFESVIGRPEFNEVLTRVLEQVNYSALLSADAYQMFMDLSFKVAKTGATSAEFSISKTVRRLRQGRWNMIDFEVTMACLQAILNKVNKYAAKYEPMVTHAMALPEFNKTLHLLDRHYAVRWTEIYFATVFDFQSSLDVLKVVFNALTVKDPVPPRTATLRATILSRAGSLLNPVRQRLNAQAAKPVVEDQPTRAIKPLRLVLKDEHAPPPQSQKRKARLSEAVDEEPEAPSWTPPAIEPARDLRAFTRFVETPRELDALSDQVTYEFWYLRERMPRARHVRIAGEVVEWMRENPIPARQMLSALHLGRSQDLPGIKRLFVTSSRFDGPLFEIKSHGSFRAMLIEVGDCWQILKVSHKDDQDREAQWLAPLE